MILVDANILLYAEDLLNPRHDAARVWWDAEEHGCGLVSTDSDFSRFPGIRWRNPIR